MTRILVLSNFYPPHDYGGYEQSCADVMNRLAGRGHDIRVLTSRRRRTDRPGEPEGPLPVDRRLHIYWSDGRLEVPPRRRRLRWEWENRRALQTALRRHRPEVVSVWNMGAMSFGLLDLLSRCPPPAVYAVCNDWLVWGADQDAWMKGWSDRPRLARAVSAFTGLPTRLADPSPADCFLFVSDWTRRTALEQGRWDLSSARTEVVYSGIEAGEFGPRGSLDAHDASAAMHPAGSEQWSWRLLFVGRLDADKGALTAVQTLAHLPEAATLEIIGPGGDADRHLLRQAAADLGVDGRVSFDQVPRSALARRYQGADVFLFPSRWEEPFGLTPLEAMACGTPVVATNLGGSAEYLRDGANALCVPKEDPEAMAAAVRRLAEDPTLRHRLVSQGQRLAAELTTDRLADVFEAWLDGAAGGFPDGPPPPRGLPQAEAVR